MLQRVDMAGIILVYGNCHYIIWPADIRWCCRDHGWSGCSRVSMQDWYGLVCPVCIALVVHTSGK